MKFALVLVGVACVAVAQAHAPSARALLYLQNSAQDFVDNYMDLTLESLVIRELHVVDAEVTHAPMADGMQPGGQPLLVVQVHMQPPPQSSGATLGSFVEEVSHRLNSARFAGLLASNGLKLAPEESIIVTPSAQEVATARGIDVLMDSVVQRIDTALEAANERARRSRKDGPCPRMRQQRLRAQQAAILDEATAGVGEAASEQLQAGSAAVVLLKSAPAGATLHPAGILHGLAGRLAAALFHSAKYHEAQDTAHAQQPLEAQAAWVGDDPRAMLLAVHAAAQQALLDLASFASMAAETEELAGDASVLDMGGSLLQAGDEGLGGPLADAPDDSFEGSRSAPVITLEEPPAATLTILRSDGSAYDVSNAVVVAELPAVGQLNVGGAGGKWLQQASVGAAPQPPRTFKEHVGVAFTHSYQQSFWEAVAVLALQALVSMMVLHLVVQLVVTRLQRMRRRVEPPLLANWEQLVVQVQGPDGLKCSGKGGFSVAGGGCKADVLTDACDQAAAQAPEGSFQK